jgi:Mg-chelatase subunit ChlD
MTNTENTIQVYNLIILDESGSMQSIKQATIGGFNETVQTIKHLQKEYEAQRHHITLLTFNGLGIKTKLFNQPVANLQELNDASYQPASMTPLFDAIGVGVTDLRKSLVGATNYTVLVTILTDGEENASKEWNGAGIKKLIEELRPQGWTFTYIGANHDVTAVAASLSIQNSMSFNANAAETQQMFRKESAQRSVYFKKMSKSGNKLDREESNYFEAKDEDEASK